MSDIFHAHRGFWSAERKSSLRLGILLLALSMAVQIGAGRYSARSSAGANFAGDIFLDNLPVVNLDFIIVEGALLLWVVVWVVLGFYPRYLLFGIKAVALFVVFRAFFISLTHIGIYPEQILINPDGAIFGLYKLFTFQGNFFFSGHTGFPFLMALIFWRNIVARRIFIFATVFFGATMLLAHAHYSVDVFAAPFITYGIFRIAAHVFPADYKVLIG